MNCQHIHDEFLLEALHDNALPPDKAAAVRAHLDTCAECRRDFDILTQLTRLPAPAAPSGRMRARFAAMLAGESAPAQPAPRRTRVFRLAFRFAAACVLFIAGLFVGARFSAPAPAQNGGFAALLEQKSANDRVDAVLATLRVTAPDRRVLADLIGSLALDPSVNVRLSAVEALAPHARETLVRSGLLAALPRENSPLVQIALIELLASTRDDEAAPVLARLCHDAQADPAVRETARRALTLIHSTPATS